jgi:hypothetical protein
MEPEVDEQPVLGQCERVTQVFVEPRVVQGSEVDRTQLRDPSDEIGAPLLGPAAQQRARDIGPQRGNARADASAQSRHEPEGERDQPGRECRRLLAAQGDESRVLPAADLPELERLEQSTELGAHPLGPDVDGLPPDSAGEGRPRQRRMTGLADPETLRRVDRQRDRLDPAVLRPVGAELSGHGDDLRCWLPQAWRPTWPAWHRSPYVFPRPAYVSGGSSSST